MTLYYATHQKRHRETRHNAIRFKLKVINHRVHDAVIVLGGGLRTRVRRCKDLCGKKIYHIPKFLKSVFVE